MFDDIDFLSPRSTAARPLRKHATPPSVELVTPPAARTPRIGEKLMGWMLQKSRNTPPARTVGKKAPPPAPSPMPASPAPRARWRKFFPAMPHAPLLPHTPARTASPPPVPAPIPSPPPPPHPEPPPPSTPPIDKPQQAPLPPSQETPRSTVSAPHHASWSQAVNRVWHRQKEKQNLSVPKNQPGAGMVEVNLLPEQERAKVGHHTRVMLVGAMALLLVCIVLGASGALSWRTKIHTQKLRLLAREIAEVEQEMAKNVTGLAQALAFQKKNRAIRELLATHTQWSSFLAFIASLTSPDVYYEGFSGDRNGTIMMKAHARNFNAAAQQLVSFRRDPRITHVSTSPLVAGDTRAGNAAEITFEITLRIDPRVIMPNLTTAPSLP